MTNDSRFQENPYTTYFGWLGSFTHFAMKGLKDCTILLERLLDALP